MQLAIHLTCAHEEEALSLSLYPPRRRPACIMLSTHSHAHGGGSGGGRKPPSGLSPRYRENAYRACNTAFPGGESRVDEEKTYNRIAQFLEDAKGMFASFRNENDLPYRNERKFMQMFAYCFVCFEPYYCTVRVKGNKVDEKKGHCNARSPSKPTKQASKQAGQHNTGLFSFVCRAPGQLLPLADPPKNS